MNNKIICGKAEEILKSFNDNYIDLCITSPPYNLDINYDNYKDCIEWDDYFKWCEIWIKEIYRVLKNDGRFIINHYFSFGTSERRICPLFVLNDICIKLGFKHNSILFWSDITVAKKTAWGSWRSASAPYINSPFEGFLVLYKNEWKKQCRGENTINKEDFMRLCSGIISDAPSRDYTHPAPFPLKTAKLLVEGFSFKKDIILDPFCGRGTTLMAAKATYRDYIGIDISPKYCKLSDANINSTYKIQSSELII